MELTEQDKSELRRTFPKMNNTSEFRPTTERIILYTPPGKPPPGTPLSLARDFEPYTAFSLHAVSVNGREILCEFVEPYNACFYYVGTD